MAQNLSKVNLSFYSSRHTSALEQERGSEEIISRNEKIIREKLKAVMNVMI